MEATNRTAGQPQQRPEGTDFGVTAHFSLPAPPTALGTGRASTNTGSQAREGGGSAGRFCRSRRSSAGRDSTGRLPGIPAALGSRPRLGVGPRSGTWRRAAPAALPGQSGRCRGTAPAKAASRGPGSLGRSSRRTRQVTDRNSVASFPPATDPSSAAEGASPRPAAAHHAHARPGGGA